MRKIKLIFQFSPSGQRFLIKVVPNKEKICFKGYLRSKTITSQIVSSEAQGENFLLSRKAVFCSQDIQVFVFLIIPWFTKSVT